MSSDLIRMEKRNSLEVNLSGANNIFGSIGRAAIPIAVTKDFIPLDNEGTILELRGTNAQAQWLGLGTTNMQYWAYIYCSPLAAVIDRLAEADTNGVVTVLDTDGSIKENYKKNPKLNRVVNLFNKPNFMQTYEDFNAELVVSCKIFGYCPVYSPIPVGFTDRSYNEEMWCLNPYFWKPERNWDFDFLGKKIEGSGGPIKAWSATIFGKSYYIDAKNVILVKDGFVNSVMNEFGLPVSKIGGLDYAVSNICAAMEADNVLLKKKGPLGVFSLDPKPDIAGWLPMENTDKKELQQELARYGLTAGQLQYIISRVPIRWNAMSFNVQELMTKETIRQGIDGICDRFGYPAELMSGKNATYENRTSAERFMYQTVVIPFSLRRMSVFNRWFDIEGLSTDYSHLPVLQEDTMKKAQAGFADSKALEIDWKNNIITYNEYRISKGRAPIDGEDGDLYYFQFAKKYKIDQKNEKPTPKNSGATK